MARYLQGAHVESTVVGAPVPHELLEQLLNPADVSEAMTTVRAIQSIVSKPRPQGRTPQARLMFEQLRIRELEIYTE